MTVYNLVQIAVIALVLAFSLLHVWRRLMPKRAMALQAQLSAMLRHDGLPGFVRLAGLRLQPPASSAKGCGDDKGCGTCNMCGTIAALTKDLPKV